MDRRRRCIDRGERGDGGWAEPMREEARGATARGEKELLLSGRSVKPGQAKSGQGKSSRGGPRRVACNSFGRRGGGGAREYARQRGSVSRRCYRGWRAAAGPWGPTGERPGGAGRWRCCWPGRCRCWRWSFFYYSLFFLPPSMPRLCVGAEGGRRQGREEAVAAAASGGRLRRGAGQVVTASSGGAGARGAGLPRKCVARRGLRAARDVAVGLDDGEGGGLTMG